MSNESKKNDHASQNESGRDQYKRHVEGSIAVHGQIETHLPSDFVKKQDTRDGEKDRRDKKRLRVEILTLAFVIIGGGFTGWYVLITRHIAKTGDESLYRQTRPWLGLDGTVYPLTPMNLLPPSQLPAAHANVPYNVDALNATGKQFISYDGLFNLRNYGASPAIHAAYSVMMALSIEGTDRASQTSCDIANRIISSGQAMSGGKGKGGITIFPNEVQREMFVAGAPATQLPDRVFLMGCVMYDDRDGKRHTTKFCQYGISGNNRAEVSCDLDTF